MTRTAMMAAAISCLAICAAAQPVQAALDVPLTVVERAGVARVDEPITSGVPLPEGLMEDTAKLTMLGPDGKAVPAQFDVTTRWYPGKSVKWVTVYFQASVPAGGKAVYRLTDGGGNVLPPDERWAKANSQGPPGKVNLVPQGPDRPPVVLPQPAETVQVTTGALQFTVKRAGFNLIDEASLDPEGKGNYTVPVIKPGTADIRLFHCGTGLPDYKKFSPADDPDVTLTVEESGPMHACIKLTGKNISKDDMAGDNHLLDFVCRIHAYAGSGLVKVDYSLECKQGKSIADGVPLDRFWFSLPMKLDAAKSSWAVGTGDGKALHPGSDEKDYPAWNDDWTKPGAEVAKYWKPGLSEAFVLSENSRRICFRGDFFKKRQELIVDPKVNKAKAATAGWMDLSDDQAGLAAGVRWFWQTYPRAIKAELAVGMETDPKTKAQTRKPELDNTALIVMLHAGMSSRPALLTREHSARAHFYPGMCKTSEVLLHFHGPRDLARIVGAQAGLQSPLRAWAEPSWYCEKTQAFGRLASSDKALYDDAGLAAVQSYDKNVRTTLDRIIKHRDLQWGEYDSYGMFNFGDTIDFMRGQQGDPDDINVTWDNCYYDYPHALFLQWARTGDPDYFDLAEQAEHHLMDVDMMSWSPQEQSIGAARYSDGTMHIRMEKGIYQSDTFNHYKNGSHFERWYLTGMKRSLEQGLVSAKFAMNPANNGAIGFGEPRSLGNGPIALLNAYLATGEQKYFDRLKFFETWYMNALDKGARIAKGRHWQGGIGLEGMREYYEHSGDPTALEHLKLQVESCDGMKDYAESTLHAFAFLGAQLDKPEWSKIAASRIGKMGDIKRDWGFGQSFGNELRNAPYVFWYLTKDLPKKLEVRPATR